MRIRTDDIAFLRIDIAYMIIRMDVDATLILVSDSANCEFLTRILIHKNAKSLLFVRYVICAKKFNVNNQDHGTRIVGIHGTEIVGWNGIQIVETIGTDYVWLIGTEIYFGAWHTNCIDIYWHGTILTLGTNTLGGRFNVKISAEK